MTKKRTETAVDLAASLTKFYATALTQPAKAMAQSLGAAQETLKSLVGTSEIKPEKGDKRFKDPVWTSNPAYRMLMESYLAWSGALTAWVDSLDVPPRDKLRVKLVSNLVTDALAPSNAVLTNPAAMKATLDQGGKNLVAGFEAPGARHDGQQRPAVDGRQVEVPTRREPWPQPRARWSTPRTISS